MRRPRTCNLKANTNHPTRTKALEAKNAYLVQEASKMAFAALSVAKKKLEAPLAKLEEILLHAPQDIDALLMKGNIIDLYFSSLHEIHEIARSCYKEVLILVPSNVCALIDMGDWYAAENEYKESIRFYNKAIRLLKCGQFYRSRVNELEEAYMGKISALKDSKRFMDARQCAKEGLRYCPESNVLRSWISTKKSMGSGLLS